MRKTNLRTLVMTCGVAAALTAFGAIGNPAHAVVITPGTPAGGETSLSQVMNSLYGAGNWVQGDPDTYTQIVNPDLTYGLDFKVAYAADNATYGIWKDGTTFMPIMSTSNGTASPTSLFVNSTTFTTSPNGIFELGFRNDATGAMFSSNYSENADLRPHILNYQILTMPNTFVFAFEDAIGGDYDYQDLVLQYTVNFNARPVPEPGTLWLLGAALMVAGAGRRIAKRDGIAAA